MTEVSKNSHSLADLEAFALSMGDSALQRKAERLHELVGNGGVEALPNADQLIALNLKNAWISVYGDDTGRWPERLRDALKEVEGSLGLSSFDNDLIAVMQNLRLSDLTVPAFNVAVAVVGKLALPGLAEKALQLQDTSDFIPEPAKRAGLSFISSPWALVGPLLAGGMAGRAVTGATVNIGRALSLTDEVLVPIGMGLGLFGEATGFVAASNVVAPFMGPDIGPMNRATTISEIASSTVFFAMLRGFGWAGGLIQSLLPMTETGVAIAKATTHATSIVGLAATEEIQEGMGGAIWSSRLQPAPSEDNGRTLKCATPGESTFSERIWRAAFLHGTIQAVNGIVGLTSTASNYMEILTRAEELQKNVFNTEVVEFRAVDGLPIGDTMFKERSDPGALNQMTETVGSPANGSDIHVIDAQYKLQVDASYRQHHDFLVRNGLITSGTILDVGTGNGYFASLLARDHPTIEFTGIDRDAGMIRVAGEVNKGLGNISWFVEKASDPDFIQRNAERFDGALMRLAAFHNPNIREILRSLNRLLRPGGHIWIIDVEMDVMRCAPEHPAFTRFKGLIEKLYEKLGFDGHLGSKLPDLLKDVGFGSVKSEEAPISSRVIGPGAFKKLMLHEMGILSSVLTGSVSEQDVEAIESFANTSLQNPNYAASYGVVMVSAVKK